MTVKGVVAIGLFLILLVTIAFWAQTFADDPLLYALAGYVILAVLSTGVILLKPFRKRLEEFVISNICITSRKLRILVVGLGRSGKTSIIRHILTDDSPKKEKSTNCFTIYEKIQRLGLSDPVEYKVSFADYKGQKLSQITNHSYRHPDFFGGPEQKLLNVIVFVADLFPEMRDSRGELLTDEQIVKRYKKGAERSIESRVNDHKLYETQVNIEQIFDLASPQNLFSVKLLINKIDLLRDVIACGYLPEVSEKNMKKYVKNLFQKIICDIKEACEENHIEDFSVHLVSARKGDNMKIIFGNISEAYHQRSRQ